MWSTKNQGRDPVVVLFNTFLQVRLNCLQISIDIPRMSPLIPIFQQPVVQQVSKLKFDSKG